MNRRNFLSRLGFGTAAVAATAVVPTAVQPAPEPVQPSLRPKCPTCGNLMLVRVEGALCANTGCPDYWKAVTITLTGPQADREKSGWFRAKMEELRTKLRPKCELCGRTSLHHIGIEGMRVCMNRNCVAYLVVIDTKDERAKAKSTNRT